jgi:hypothetical protein
MVPDVCEPVRNLRDSKLAVENWKTGRTPRTPHNLVSEHGHGGHAVVALYAAVAWRSCAAHGPAAVRDKSLISRISWTLSFKMAVALQVQYLCARAGEGSPTELSMSSALTDKNRF